MKNGSFWDLSQLKNSKSFGCNIKTATTKIKNIIAGGHLQIILKRINKLTKINFGSFYD